MKQTDETIAKELPTLFFILTDVCCVPQMNHAFELRALFCEGSLSRVRNSMYTENLAVFCTGGTMQ